MERHKENMEGKQIYCVSFVKVMVQGARAVSNSSNSCVLSESCAWWCRSSSSGSTSYPGVVYSQSSVINCNSPTEFLIRK